MGGHVSRGPRDHTCAALLIDAGARPLRLQHWMGHHSAAFTLNNYGHLIDDSLGPHLSLPAT
jgi:integrase